MHARARNKARRAKSNGRPAPGMLSRFYHTLHRELGPQHWWPAETPFEVIIGAILTQSTSWTNVELAIHNLRREGLLTPAAMRRASHVRLERLVRPSGYFRQKARKLRAFLDFLFDEYGGSLDKMFSTPTAVLREKLLGVHGIGPETADSILLYAGQHPVFVVDAYTQRVLSRHGLVPEPSKSGNGRPSYEHTRELLESNLPRDPQLYNEYHALLVQVGKHWCRPQQALCDECPLGPLLPRSARPVVISPRSVEARPRATEAGS
ncbi:MAG TPA: hypothetical protein VGA40_05875 [Candidatus Acidoferrales bacterium]